MDVYPTAHLKYVKDSEYDNELAGPIVASILAPKS